jgi:hypothetical protein
MKPRKEANPIVMDPDPEDEGGRQVGSILVSQFIRMWPREIFDAAAEPEKGQRASRKTIARAVELLAKPGVYILYRDDIPFYIGQAKKLQSRLKAHATNPNAKRYLFWNSFSAYLIDNPNHLDEVEAILIAAMPFVLTNSSMPKLKRVRMDHSTVRLVNRLRKQRVKG